MITSFDSPALISKFSLFSLTCMSYGELFNCSSFCIQIIKSINTLLPQSQISGPSRPDQIHTTKLIHHTSDYALLTGHDEEKKKKNPLEKYPKLSHFLRPDSFSLSIALGICLHKGDKEIVKWIFQDPLVSLILVETKEMNKCKAITSHSLPSCCRYAHF